MRRVTMTEDEMEALLEEFNGVLDADDRTVFCDRAPGSLANRLREMGLEAQLSQEDGVVVITTPDFRVVRDGPTSNVDWSAA